MHDTNTIIYAYIRITRIMTNRLYGKFPKWISSHDGYII